MSTADFKGAAHAVKVLMQQAADEIAAGKALPARVIFARPEHVKVRILRWWPWRKQA